MSAGGARTRSSLLILDTGGLLDYDPAWNVRSIPLGQGLNPKARALAAFGGNLYVLDTGANQLWRYRPQGDGYEAADKYFDVPPGDLSNVVDVAVDGNVYLLYSDGHIRKFFAGKEIGFAITGVTQIKPVALTVDTTVRQSMIYIADMGGMRIIQLSTDGTLIRQIRATNDALSALEDVLVDEATGRLFVISGSKLYVGRLPALTP